MKRLATARSNPLKPVCETEFATRTRRRATFATEKVPRHAAARRERCCHPPPANHPLRPAETVAVVNLAG